MSGTSPYLGLAEHCAKLDKRNTKYQFDLDVDVDWARLDAPGDYFGPSLLGALGINVGALRREPQAWQLFQWAFALSTCEDFIALEQLILRFTETERGCLGETRSLELLVEEERKHIALFRRYSAHLRAHAPGGSGTCDAFDAVYGETPMILTRRLDEGDYPDQATHHYLFWLTTVFFEDYTIYLHERLAAESSGLQPAWLSAHAAHRREEEQHVVTDTAFIDALALPEDQRHRWSMLFYIWMTENADRFFGLDAPQKLVASAFPDLSVRMVASVSDAPFFDDLLYARLFRRTRHAAPYIERLRQQGLGADGGVVGAPTLDAAAPVEEARGEEDLPRMLRRRAGELLGRLRDKAAVGTRIASARLSPEQAEQTEQAEQAEQAEQTELPKVPQSDDGDDEPSVDEVVEVVRAIWAAALELPVDQVEPNRTFSSLGGDSQRAVEMLGLLEKHYGRFLDHRLLIECRTPREAAAYLCRDGLHQSGSITPPLAPASLSTLAGGGASDGKRRVEHDIAIVAMQGRFAGAPDLDALWNLVESGQTSIGEVPAQRWDAARFYDSDPHAPGKTMCVHGGFVADIESFDPAAFGLDDAQVVDMDPQQRLFLQASADLLDMVDAGTRRIGVFSGSGWNDYMMRHVADPRLIGSSTALGNLQHMVAARVSQVLKLQGPAMNVAAACATSLVAVHLACQSIRAGECDMAIAGGVELYLTPTAYILFSQAGVLSASGACRPFCSEADGFVPGEGVGAVLLEPLSRAIERGHPIAAVIRGSAVNNDGGSLSGMAPSPTGQLGVLRAAYRDARVDPATVSYVEAHGTGTAIGDPIEVRALSQLFTEAGAGPGDVVLGSVKANIGHTFTTAGVAGLINAVQCLQHRTLTPLAGNSGHDTRIDFSSSPLAPIVEPQPWQRSDGAVLRAGVSAFGIGGTNCHMVIEQAPERSGSVPEQRPCQVLCIAAPTEADVARIAEGHLEVLRSAGAHGFADAVAGVNARADRFEYRRSVVGSNVDEMAEAFAAEASVVRAAVAPRIAFAFSGPGSQYPGMAHALWRDEPVFRRAIERCSAVLEPLLPLRLEDYLYREPTPDDPGMNRIEVTQPIVFSVGYALAVWLESLGVVADAVLGHSAGEYIAACVAGVLDLPTALTLVARRGQCMSRSEPGKMAAVFASEDAVRAAIARCGSHVGIAAVNDPTQIVVSGASPHVDELLTQLEADGIAVRELPISCAAHSPLMVPMQPQLAEYAAHLAPRPANVPFYSTVTGARVGVGTVLDAAYWVDHLRAPVQFASAVDAVASDGYGVIVEIGPSGGLAHCIERVVGGRARAVPLMRRVPDGWHTPLAAIGALHECGVPVDLQRICTGRLGEVVVPPYAYRPRSLWLDAPHGGGESLLGGGPMVVDVSQESSVLDHVVRGEPIAPAALLLELARSASDATVLEDVLIGRPLGVGNGPRLARVRVPAGDRRTLSVESRGHSDQDWALHLSASVGESDGLSEAHSIDVDALWHRCGEKVSPSAVYEQLDATGLVYGPRMRAVKAMSRRREDGRPVEVVAALSLPLGAERDGVLNPAIVDGAMQTIAGLIADATPELDDEPLTYLGFAMKRVAVFAATPDTCIAHVQLRSRFTPGIESFRCDVTLATTDGTCIARFEQVGLKRLHTRSPVYTATINWAPADLVPTLGDALPSTTVLIRGGVPGARELSKAMRRRCEDAGVHVLEAAAPTDAAEAAALVRRLMPVESLVAVDVGVQSLMALSQALAAAQVTELAAFSIVGGHEDCTGFARVLDQEHPRWRCLRLQLDAAARAESNIGSLVVAEMWSRGAQLVVAYRGRRRLVPVIVDAGPALAQSPWRDGGVYWLTGGLGGIGQAVAGYLGRTFGARLLLTGRRACPAGEELAGLEAMGAEVLYVQADVTDAAAMCAARDAAMARWGCINGVIHAAGVLDDGLIRSRDLTRVRRVLAPKVDGSHVVVEATAQLSLDFIAFFSSLAALVGGPGQADYAAANARMDEIAGDLVREGRVVTINWGPWRDVGMVADEATRAALAERGLVALSTREGVAALSDALARTERQVVVTGLAAGMTAAMQQHFNRRVAATVVPDDRELEDGEAPPVREFLRHQLGRALRVGASDVDLRTSLVRLGVDSLMAVEMVKRLERRYAIKLYPTLLFEHETLEQVAAYVEDLLVDAPRTAAAPVVTRLANEVADGGVVAHLVGGEPGLHLGRVAVPVAGRDDVAIDVHACGVNFIDVLATTGMHPLLGDARFVPGHEVAGVVAAAGKDVHGFSVGDRVIAITRHGGYARRVVTPAASVVHLPESLSMEQGAGLVITGLTAIACIEHHGRVTSGERVLIQAAAGGTGSACVQLAKHLGAEIFGTAGAPAKLELLRTMGVDHAINYRTERFDDAVRAAMGSEGIDVIVDSLSGDAITRGLALLRPGGRFIEIGGAGVVEAPSVDPTELFMRDISFVGCNVGHLERNPDRLAAHLHRLVELVALGVLRPHIGHRVPFEHASEAHALLRERKNVGKVVLMLDPAGGVPAPASESR